MYAHAEIQISSTNSIVIMLLTIGVNIDVNK